MINPPISRLGGKSRLRKAIIERIPEHTCYTEGFFGAGWVYFGKEMSRVEVINDIDGELVNLFRVIKYHAEELNRYLNFEIISRDQFKCYSEQNTQTLTEIQRAIRYLYLVNYSFASKGGNFGYSAVQGPKKKLNSDELLIAIKRRLQNTYVENLDYKKLIDKYDREMTFFYLDPPYYDTAIDFHKHNPITFQEMDHIELRDKCTNINGKFLLSINDHPWIREIYRDFKIEPIDVNYSCGKGKNENAQELLISNY